METVKSVSRSWREGRKGSPSSSDRDRPLWRRLPDSQLEMCRGQLLGDPFLKPPYQYYGDLSSMKKVEVYYCKNKEALFSVQWGRNLSFSVVKCIHNFPYSMK